MTVIYDLLFVFLTFNMSKIKINPYFGEFYAKKNITHATPLDELDRFTECIDILNICSNNIEATFDQLPDQLNKNFFVDTGLNSK